MDYATTIIAKFSAAKLIALYVIIIYNFAYGVRSASDHETRPTIEKLSTRYLTTKEKSKSQQILDIVYRENQLDFLEYNTVIYLNQR